MFYNPKIDQKEKGKLMFKYLILLICMGMFCLHSPNGIHAALWEDDFSNTNLSPSWQTSGDVGCDAGYAFLGDNSGTDSLLYQGISAINGSYTLEFDFWNGLSDWDALYASVYFINDLSKFYIDQVEPWKSVFDDSLALFDLNGQDHYIINGTIVDNSLSLGPGWQHFSVSFDNSYGYIIPTFDFINWNYMPNDSQVRIDNIQLSANAAPAPEPSTGLLFFMGVAAAVSLQRRIKS